MILQIKVLTLILLYPSRRPFSFEVRLRASNMSLSISQNVAVLSQVSILFS